VVGKKTIKSSALQMIDQESKRYEEEKRREREDKKTKRKKEKIGRRGSLELLHSN